MPLYEYRCPHCNKDFEKRVKPSERGWQLCPTCNQPVANPRIHPVPNTYHPSRGR